jgi:hypothetical protein
MGPDKPTIIHRPVATVPENQLEQAVSAMEVLGNLQHPTCQQQAPDFTFTGMPAGVDRLARCNSLCTLPWRRGADLRISQQQLPEDQSSHQHVAQKS